jgi:hypothetical protein
MDDVSRTLYQGGSIVLIDDVEVDTDIYTLTVKGNLDFSSESELATKEITDDLQSQITALEARVTALETPA